MSTHAAQPERLPRRGEVDPRQIALIAFTWVRHSVRNGSAILGLVLTMVIGLIFSDLVLQPITLLADAGLARSPEEALGISDEMNRSGISWLLGGEFSLLDQRQRGPVRPTGRIDPFEAFETTDADRLVAAEREARVEAWAKHLVRERPSILSFLFLIFLLVTPTLAVGGGFNLLSGDIASRALRFQLFRTTRTSLFLGRFIGSYVSTSLSLLVLVATISIYAGANVPSYDIPTCLGWGAWGWIALTITALPYVALTAGVSGLFSASWVSFTVGLSGCAAVKLASVVGRMAWQPLEWFAWILPWGVQNHLFHPEWSHRLGAVAACLGYTLVFLAIGLRIFRRRDV